MKRMVNPQLRVIMIAKYMLQIFLTFGITIVSGFVDLTCSSSRVYLGDQLTCTCTTDSAAGIDWQIDSGSLFLCFSATGNCTHIPAEYDVTNDVSGISEKFQITIKSFDYTNCGNIICKDKGGSDTATERLSLYAFNASVPVSISENVTSDSGEISITTDCIYRKEEIKTTWYTMTEGNEEEYTPDSSYSTPSPCVSDVCGAETAYTLKNGFYYTKGTKNPLKVKFKVKMYHERNTSLALELTTADDYYIEGKIEGPRCGWCWWGVCYDCNGDVGILVICWIVFPPTIFLILYIAGIIIGVILTKTRCCCRGFYHCGDSDCCECCQGSGKNKCVTCACCASLPFGVCCNIDGLPFWVQVLWGSIIGTPVALGIYTVWKCCGRENKSKYAPTGNDNEDAKCEDFKPETRSGNPCTGQKKPNTKNKSKVSSQTENEQHDQGRKPREQPLIPLVSQTTEAPLSGRPMPDIPRKSDKQGHDSKGRELSANFSDDNHPLVSIDIPLQKRVL